MKTRFAPSPTGLMHFGNLRTALFNYLLAKKTQQQFLLRIEDTDQARSEQQYVDELLADLKWLGIVYDELAYQSERQEIYNEYYEKLIAQEAAYPCFCTEQQLAISRKTQLSAGKPPRYTGTCRYLTAEEIAVKKQKGLKPTLRFKMPKDEMIEFVDLVKGQQRFASNDIGDFIIRRQDGSASFMFCNAVDDALMGVTHALRGDDHLTNTPRQIMILNALKLTPPAYGHFAMIHGQDGAPLSKRNGSEAVKELREKGYHPLALMNYLARLGHYYEQIGFMSLAELADQFDLLHVNTAPAKHDVAHLKHWQKEALHRLSDMEFWNFVAPHVMDIVPANKQHAFASLIKANIIMPEEARQWAVQVVKGEIDWTEHEEILYKTGSDFFTIMQGILKSQPKDYSDFLSQLTKKTGCKGKSLFLPLRILLSGQIAGPELPKLYDMVGVVELEARVVNALECVNQRRQQY